MILETERLVLRPFRESDLDDYAALCADPEVMKYLNAAGVPISRADAWRRAWGLPPTDGAPEGAPDNTDTAGEQR